jgi:hypothetical protein
MLLEILLEINKIFYKLNRKLFLFLRRWSRKTASRKQINPTYLPQFNQAVVKVVFMNFFRSTTITTPRALKNSPNTRLTKKENPQRKVEDFQVRIL